ncbi:MAG: O-antigen ligase family protein [Alphaproteobacteria bacterium]|nr:O-antigen ligase family protein [Alphaproteobacteria bacterium]
MYTWQAGKISLPDAFFTKFWPLLAFLIWSLLACTWSLTPSVNAGAVAKIVLSLCVGASVYSYLQWDSQTKFMKWFATGYIIALSLLILDEILNTYILRSLRGPHMETKEYSHGLTLLVLSLWSMMTFLKEQHLSRKLLLYVTLFIGLFYMTDHSATLAFFVSTVVFFIVYFSPKFFIRLSAVLSVVVIMSFPLLMHQIDPQQVIQSAGSVLLKKSYHHRLFILKRTATMIFKRPWMGHGLDSYRSTTDTKADFATEVSKLHVLEQNPELNPDVLGQATHPHNFSLQLWFELGAIGAVLFSLFLFTSLWRISSTEGKTLEKSAFMGTYSGMFLIAHTAFGAWQTWWLISTAVILAINYAYIYKKAE